MTPKQILEACTHIACRRCGGRGKYDTSCSFCGDSTYDHDCDSKALECEDCKGSGRGPNPCRACADRAVAAADEQHMCELGVTTAEAEATQRRLDEALAKVARLRGLLNTPEVIDFAKAVQIEAAPQRERWGSDHDAGKTDADWFWLIGYLAGKALHNPGETGDGEKRLHRIVTIAAAAANWHAAVLGRTNMRPGIEPPAGEQP